MEIVMTVKNVATIILLITAAGLLGTVLIGLVKIFHRCAVRC